MPKLPYWPPHITVATIVQRNDQFLMVEENDQARSVINQPAGHLEPGETLIQAALRETLEETGWQVDLTGFVGVYQYRANNNEVLYLRIAFLGRPIAQMTTETDPDISSVHWLTRDEISEFPQRSPLVLKCIDDAMQNGPLPLSLVQHY